MSEEWRQHRQDHTTPHHTTSRPTRCRLVLYANVVLWCGSRVCAAIMKQKQHPHRPHRRNPIPTHQLCRSSQRLSSTCLAPQHNLTHKAQSDSGLAIQSSLRNGEQTCYHHTKNGTQALHSLRNLQNVMYDIVPDHSMASRTHAPLSCPAS